MTTYVRCYCEGPTDVMIFDSSVTSPGRGLRSKKTDAKLGQCVAGHGLSLGRDPFDDLLFE